MKLSSALLGLEVNAWQESADLNGLKLVALIHIQLCCTALGIILLYLSLLFQQSSCHSCSAPTAGVPVFSTQLGWKLPPILTQQFLCSLPCKCENSGRHSEPLWKSVDSATEAGGKRVQKSCHSMRQGKRKRLHFPLLSHNTHLIGYGNIPRSFAA